MGLHQSRPLPKPHPNALPICAANLRPLGDAHDALVAVNNAVAVALGRPLQSFTGPRVMRGDDDGNGELISYVRLADRLVFDGVLRDEFDAVGGRRPLPVSDYLRRRKSGSVGAPLASPSDERERWWRMNPTVVPGKGGRKRRLSPFTDDFTIGALLRRHGDPIHHSTTNGARMFVWEMDPDGDGLILARLSGREAKDGETVAGQVHAAERLLESSSSERGTSS